MPILVTAMVSVTQTPRCALALLLSTVSTVAKSATIVARMDSAMTALLVTDLVNVKLVGLHALAVKSFLATLPHAVSTCKVIPRIAANVAPLAS